MRLSLSSLCLLLSIVACERGAPSPFAPPPPAPTASTTNAVPVAAASTPPDARTAEPAPAACPLVSTLTATMPPKTAASFMISPDIETVAEADVTEEIGAAESPVERVRKAASVLGSEGSKIDVTPLRDGSYRVRVRAVLGQAATCHGRTDKVDLAGIARVSDESVELTATGPDEIVEDMCNFDGRRSRDFVRRVHAKATLRTTRRCSARP